MARLGLPDQLFAADISAFEQEVNQLRTHQGQSDVFVINEQGTILAPTFGGGANSLVTEVLGEAAIISSDFGGNPPYEKMKAVAVDLLPALPGADQRALHHRRQVEQHRHPRDLPRAWATRCASISPRNGPTPLYVVVGRGGPNLVRGMGNLAETLESLGLPYRFFGFDSAISEVVNYAKRVDDWMRAGGREEIAASLGMKAEAA